LTAEQAIAQNQNHTLDMRADERNVWLAWVLSGTAGGVFGLAIAAETPAFLVGVVPSGDEANTSGWMVGWAILLGGALAGITFGGTQRLVLRRMLPRLEGWVRVSTAGFAAAFTVVWALGGASYGDLAHHALPTRSIWRARSVGHSSGRRSGHPSG
jgi:hypothetical protein